MITQENIPYTADEIKAMVKTCEKYNEALERAKDMLAYKEVRQEDMEYIFPELKESKDKDEMIRQCLIEHIKCNKDLNWSLFQWFKPDTIIDWLEKQGDKYVNIDVESMVSSYEQRLESQGGTKYTPLVSMCLTAFRHGVENVLEELNLKKLEKQSEKKGD